MNGLGHSASQPSVERTFQRLLHILMSNVRRLTRITADARRIVKTREGDSPSRFTLFEDAK